MADSNDTRSRLRSLLEFAILGQLPAPPPPRPRNLSPAEAERWTPAPIGLEKATSIGPARSSLYGLERATNIGPARPGQFGNLPRAGEAERNPPLLRLSSLFGWLDPFGLGQDASYNAADLPMPVGAGKAAAARAGTSLLALATGGKTEDVLAVAKTLFPKLDKYSKPAGHLTRATILKRLDAASDIAPEVKASLTQLAEQVGDRRISPLELQAMVAGEAYTPERVLRKVREVGEGEKQIPGAPLGVTNARQEAARREQYLKLLATPEGIEGRDWYRDAGGAIRFYANDDPRRAMMLAEDTSATSSATTVAANAGFGVKGYNQATAGVPIEAGRFPTAMGERIAGVHSGEEGLQGLKQTPFAENIAEAGGFLQKDNPAERATHDIWEGEAYGYVDESGAPLRRGFTPAEHRWMDEQTKKIVIEANRRGIGGFTDWDHKRAQAAAWVAAMVKAGNIKLEDAAKSYAAFYQKLVTQGSRETIPGISTRHMAELHHPNAGEFRQLLHDIVMRESGIYDAQMRDQIAAGYGALSGRSFEGPGVFQGATSPGMQTQVLTGSVEVPGGGGARVLDEGSRALMDAIEGTYGILNAQDAAAYSRLLPAGSHGARGAWDVVLPGGRITPAQMEEFLSRLGPEARKTIIPIPTPTGLTIAYPPDERDTSQLVFKFLRDMGGDVKAAVQPLGGKIVEAGTLQGNLIGNDWRVQQVGQGYFGGIKRLLGGPAKFDAFAPALAATRRSIDTRFAKETGGRVTLSPIIDEVLGTIAGEGWAGLERLATKYAIPVTLLVAGLTELGAAVPPEAPEAGPQ